MITDILLIYSGENIPIQGQSVFLAGCSPRKDQVLLWREFAIKFFKEQGFEGTLIIPEPRYGNWYDFEKVVEWEDEYLKSADIILFWIPRNLEENIYGLTSNVEFGRYLHSGKIIYGRPDESSENRYLDYWYKKIYGVDPFSDLNLLVNKVVETLKGVSFAN